MAPLKDSPTRAANTRQAVRRLPAQLRERETRPGRRARRQAGNGSELPAAAQWDPRQPGAAGRGSAALGTFDTRHVSGGPGGSGSVSRRPERQLR